MSEALNELLKFIQIGARLDLKAIAVEHVLGLTGTEDGIQTICQKPPLLVSLISLLADRTVPIARDASLCLINISSNGNGASALVNIDLNTDCPPLQIHPQNIVSHCLRHIFDKDSKIADQCCMILSNLSRPTNLIDKVADIVDKTDNSFDELIEIFTRKEYNKSATLHYLGPVLSNLSQSRQIRKYILDKEKCVIQRLLTFTEYKDSLVRRGGIVGTLKNCCFQTDHHEWLLSNDVDILPRLLLPLAGPEEFDEEDNDKLPLDLQYLPENKKREEDPDIRCILIEAVTQLCSKRANREYIRGKNTYIILRELHKWEKDKKVLHACENLVDILLRTEEEIAEDNLKELEIPIHFADKFHKINDEILNEKL